VIRPKTPERPVGATRKLVLIGLIVLVLPWSGCQYARQMDAALRRGEERSLTAAARTLAVTLRGRTELLYRGSGFAALTPLGALDLQPILLRSSPLLEGFTGEWPPVSRGWLEIEHGTAALRLLTGVYERMLYVLIEVHDAHVVFDSPDGDPLDPNGFGDRIWIGYQDPEGEQHQVYVSTIGPGPVGARRIEPRGYDEAVVVDEPRIAGNWRLTSGGYRVELRIPLSMLGGRFGVLVDERDTRGGDAKSFGTLDPDSLAARGRLVVADPGLDAYLARFVEPGTRIRVLTPPGGPLAGADELGVPGGIGARPGFLATLYRRLLERRVDRQPVTGTAPIGAAGPGPAIGLVEVSEAPEHWLALRDVAVVQILEITAVITALVLVGVLAVPVQRR